ncbi:MSP-domain protein like family member (4G39) [Cryptosporidium felis]|nr:MSP-domain protein like family member (4G39) [Cryptosporidium felis]
MGNAQEKVDLPKSEESEKRGKKPKPVEKSDNLEKVGGKKESGKAGPEVVKENKGSRKKEPPKKVDLLDEVKSPQKEKGKSLVDSDPADEPKLESRISLKDRLSMKRKCKRNIPPCSRVPEPEYKIYLLIFEKFEGPFNLELKVEPCELRITGFEGVILKRIRKRDILFLQTMHKDMLRMYIRGSEEEEEGTSDKFNEGSTLESQNQYTVQYVGEVTQVICKFSNSQDSESFEFFFSFIYGLIVHSNKVKVPVSDFVDFGEYVIGSSKNILKRLDEYKDLNQKLCEDESFYDEKDNEEDFFDSYENKMIAQEREFFSRKSLELILKTDFNFGIDNSGVPEDDEEEERIIRERQEKYSKFFPVAISGEAESGGIITFRDISVVGIKYKPEVIEWRISTNIGGSKAEYCSVPISVSRTLQISEEHSPAIITGCSSSLLSFFRMKILPCLTPGTQVGRYIQARIFRHIGQDLSDTFIFSEAQSNIVIPGENLLLDIADLLMHGKAYRVDISTNDALLLLSVQNPQYYIQLMRQYNYNDNYAFNPMISCILDIKHSNIKLLIPTPSILKSYFQNSKVVPLCLSYNEFILTRKCDWFGYKDYPRIYECLMKQGELLEKVSLIISLLEGQRKDIPIYFATNRDRAIVYFSILFRQLCPNFSLEEIRKETREKKFVLFKKQFIQGFKKANWRSRLLLLSTHQAGTYITQMGGKGLAFNPDLNLSDEEL